MPNDQTPTAPAPQHFDLCIIGSGSGNSIVDGRFADQRVAIVEKGTFGGTCLNVGCIPTKMYVYPADMAAAPHHTSRVDVDLKLEGVHWSAMRDRIFGRIDPISAGGRAWRAGEENHNVTLIEEPAHFTGPHELTFATGRTLTADRFVIAAGSRVLVPDFPGLEQVDYYTSDTVMRIDALPASMIIIGAGYVAAEFAHVFASFGVAVTIIGRKSVLLRNEDDDVAARFTELLGRRVRLQLDSEVQKVTAGADGGIEVAVQTADQQSIEITAELLLVATGRTPNGDTLDLAAAGVDTDEDGYVVVDEHQLTSVDHIYALGDVSSHHQLKHVANHEARVVQHNVLHPDQLQASDHRFVPHAVFSAPQVAGVGLTEREAQRQRRNYLVGRTDYGSTAYGWAMEDQHHFAKVLVDAETDLILGAHLIGPEASILIQPLIQAMSFGSTAQEVARGQYWIHPALTEVIENALLSLRPAGSCPPE